jgi:CRISPR-associated protein Cmr2
MTQATHAAISRACNAFALTVVPALVREKLAHLIYAGGNDVLALVSLDDALELARDIRLAFGGHMDIENGRKVTGFDKGRGFYQVNGELIQTFGNRAGLSGSLVIFHHKYPLQVAVEESRRAEEWAKSVKDKDALAIRIIRRSGQPTHCRIRWTNKDRSPDPIHDLSLITRAVGEKALSPRFFSILKGLLARPEAKQLPPEAIELLLKRELGRHWDNDQTDQAQLSQDTVQSAIWELQNQTPCSEEWLAALETAVFLARGGR